MWGEVPIIGYFGVSLILFETESYLIVLSPWFFFHRYLYFTYKYILCLHPFCYITSQSSGRNASPVILHTVIFVFYQCYHVNNLLDHFISSSLRTSTLIYIIRFRAQGIVTFVCDTLQGEQVIHRHFVLSVTRFWESRLSVIILSLA